MKTGRKYGEKEKIQILIKSLIYRILRIYIFSFYAFLFFMSLPKMETIKDINRIKVVLVEKKRTNKWLAEQLGKDPATVSKWCTNTSQPGLETLLQIANVLEVDVKELLNSSLDESIQIVRLVK